MASRQSREEIVGGSAMELIGDLISSGLIPPDGGKRIALEKSIVQILFNLHDDAIEGYKSKKGSENQTKAAESRRKKNKNMVAAFLESRRANNEPTPPAVSEKLTYDYTGFYYNRTNIILSPQTAERHLNTYWQEVRGQSRKS